MMIRCDISCVCPRTWTVYRSFYSVRVATSGLQVEQDHVTSGPLQILTGYPQHSLCKRLSLSISISYWMETG